MNAADTTTDDVATTPQWVQVAVLGGDVHQLDFTPGATVSEVLAAANIDVQQGMVVQVNGRASDLGASVEAGSVVQVVSRVKNG